jgi:hypothetical protein
VSHVEELSFETAAVLGKYPREKSELLAQKKPTRYSRVCATGGVPVDFGKHAVLSAAALVPHGHGTQKDAPGNVEIQFSGHACANVDPTIETCVPARLFWQYMSMSGA